MRNSSKGFVPRYAGGKKDDTNIGDLIQYGLLGFFGYNLLKSFRSKGTTGNPAIDKQIQSKINEAEANGGSVAPDPNVTTRSINMTQDAQGNQSGSSYQNNSATPGEVTQADPSIGPQYNQQQALFNAQRAGTPTREGPSDISVVDADGNQVLRRGNLPTAPMRWHANSPIASVMPSTYQYNNNQLWPTPPPETGGYTNNYGTPQAAEDAAPGMPRGWRPGMTPSEEIALRQPGARVINPGERGAVPSSGSSSSYNSSSPINVAPDSSSSSSSSGVNVQQQALNRIAQQGDSSTNSAQSSGYYNPASASASQSWNPSANPQVRPGPNVRIVGSDTSGTGTFGPNTFMGGGTDSFPTSNPGNPPQMPQMRRPAQQLFSSSSGPAAQQPNVSLYGGNGFPSPGGATMSQSQAIQNARNATQNASGLGSFSSVPPQMNIQQNRIQQSPASTFSSSTGYKQVNNGPLPQINNSSGQSSGASTQQIGGGAPQQSSQQTSPLWTPNASQTNIPIAGGAPQQPNLGLGRFMRNAGFNPSAPTHSSSSSQQNSAGTLPNQPQSSQQSSSQISPQSSQQIMPPPRAPHGNVQQIQPSGAPSGIAGPPPGYAGPPPGMQYRPPSQPQSPPGSSMPQRSPAGGARPPYTPPPSNPMNQMNIQQIQAYQANNPAPPITPNPVPTNPVTPNPVAPVAYGGRVPRYADGRKIGGAIGGGVVGAGAGFGLYKLVNYLRSRGLSQEQIDANVRLQKALNHNPTGSNIEVIKPKVFNDGQAVSPGLTDERINSFFNRNDITRNPRVAQTMNQGSLTIEPTGGIVPNPGAHFPDQTIGLPYAADGAIIPRYSNGVERTDEFAYQGDGNGGDPIYSGNMTKENAGFYNRADGGSVPRYANGKKAAAGIAGGWGAVAGGLGIHRALTKDPNEPFFVNPFRRRQAAGEQPLIDNTPGLEQQQPFNYSQSFSADFPDSDYSDIDENLKSIDFMSASDIGSFADGGFYGGNRLGSVYNKKYFDSLRTGKPYIRSINRGMNVPRYANGTDNSDIKNWGIGGAAAGGVGGYLIGSKMGSPVAGTLGGAAIGGAGLLAAKMATSYKNNH